MRGGVVVPRRYHVAMASPVRIGPLNIGRPDLCGRCRQPFDPLDPDMAAGLRRYESTAFCRGCVSRCHESTDFAHECVICR